MFGRSKAENDPPLPDISAVNTVIDGIDFATVNPENKWQMIKSQRRFAAWAFFISFGLIMQGFDLVANGQLAALPEFQKKFGHQQPDGSYLIAAHILTAWSSIAPACEVVTAFIYAPLLEKFGRKPGILVSAFVSTAAVLVQQYAQNWKVHLVGRGINGFAIGIIFTISPLWIGENARPELRGFFLCFFNTAIVTGQCGVVIVGHIGSHIHGKWQWWLPVVGMYVFPVVLVAGYFFFPESPYWLLREGRRADAVRSLRRVHGIKEEGFYVAEVRRIEEEIRIVQEVQAADEHKPITILGVDWSHEVDCFRGPNRMRTCASILVAWAQQLIGAPFVVGYATYFVELIGVANPFNATIALYVLMVVASSCAFPLTEIVGRRTLLVKPGFFLVFVLLLIGVMGCVPKSHEKGANYAIIAFMYVWTVVFQVTISATGFVIASEVATMRLRAATQGLVTIFNAVASIVMSVVLPYLMNPDEANLKGKLGFAFMGTGSIVALLGYFLYPETQGLSIDKIDYLYEIKTPPRHFKKVAASIDWATVLSTRSDGEEKKGDVVLTESVAAA
ncbi:hypothetical protein KEM52_000176 [Ascosphaera acerosa]|nr:hypothetical protein KEM52_000176 [Ascosphaera acerosa]